MDVSGFRNVCFHSPYDLFTACLAGRGAGRSTSCHRMRQQAKRELAGWIAWWNGENGDAEICKFIGDKGPTDRLLYFQKYLGESMLFQSYIPFPKSKGFWGGAKKPEARRDFHGKTVQYTTVSSKKIDSQVSLPFEALSNKSMDGNFPTSWRDLQIPQQLWNRFFLAGGHQWSCLTICLVLGVEFRFISVSVVV